MRLKTLSDDFINKLAGLSAGALPPQDFEQLLKLFQSEIKKHFFTYSSESNLLRIIQSRYDKTFFLSECIKYPHYVDILIAVASNSNYLSDILVVNPEFFYLVVNPSTLKTKLEREKFNEEVNGTLENFHSLDRKVHAIKALKRREILRIGLKDVYGKADLNEITEELSILASCLTSELFAICYNHILSKYNIEKTARSYCIISLGKLGGNELNYSSDIDLIIFYDKESKIGIRYYSEILSETIKLFLEKSSSSEGGFLYRVDLRLRPDGKSSPVCRGLREYLDYYESRGNDWERQMLIKAGFLGGNKNLFEIFRKYVDNFVYPSSHYTSPLEQMNRLKKIIEDKLEGEENIKLVPGGIRDIEFIIQGLQLLNAGKNPNLKTGNTVVAVQRLAEAKLFSQEESELLGSAYNLYRRIEHYLQLMNNAQTHLIPETGEIAEKLSAYFDYKSVVKFRSEVGEYKIAVRKIFNSLVSIKTAVKIPLNNFRNIKFANLKKAESNITFLREGKGLTTNRRFDKKSIESFIKIEGKLYKYLKSSTDPDKTLSNFVRVIKFAEFPSIWYKEFDDDEFFNLFLRLCEFSQKTIDLSAEDKELRELFLSRDVFKKTDVEKLQSISVKKVMFLLASQLALKIITAEGVSFIINKTIKEKIRSTVIDFSKNRKWRDDFFVAAIGSTGTGDMSFASDVDLIFVVKDIDRFSNVQTDFQKLLQLIKDSLVFLPVDCRLRPEGKSSQLVWDLESYKKYYHTRARIWEIQSFLKINFIAGNKKLFNNLINSYLKSISKLSDKDILKGMLDMRSKALSTFHPDLELIDLKKNPGGLLDIEYTAHYVLLCNHEKVKENIGNPVPEILRLFARRKKQMNVLTELADNYIFLKELNLYNQLAFNTNSSRISNKEEQFVTLSSLIEFYNALSLKSKLKQIFKFNRDIFSKFLIA